MSSDLLEIVALTATVSTVYCVLVFNYEVLCTLSYNVRWPRKHMVTVGIMTLSAIISEMSRNTSFRRRPSRNPNTAAITAASDWSYWVPWPLIRGLPTKRMFLPVFGSLVWSYS